MEQLIAIAVVLIAATVGLRLAPERAGPAEREGTDRPDRREPGRGAGAG